jgi:hypothetical protein
MVEAKVYTKYKKVDDLKEKLTKNSKSNQAQDFSLDLSMFPEKKLSFSRKTQYLTI